LGIGSISLAASAQRGAVICGLIPVESELLMVITAATLTRIWLSPHQVLLSALGLGVSAGTTPRRPRREVTVPFSTRIALVVQDVIDAAVDGGERAIRNVVAEAIREKYG
jgi:hypothetical protein